VTAEPAPGRRTVSGLRTRYYPKNRIGQGLITVGPWIDIVMIVILFVILDARLVLQPGVTVDLPTASFSDGSRARYVAVVMSVGSQAVGTRRHIVFFDDVRFVAGEAEQMRNLEHAFAGQAGEHPRSDLVIHADESVPHGTIVEIMTMALNVGFEHVSLASREQE